MKALYQLRILIMQLVNLCENVVQLYKADTQSCFTYMIKKTLMETCIASVLLVF